MTALLRIVIVVGVVGAGCWMWMEALGAWARHRTARFELATARRIRTEKLAVEDLRVQVERMRLRRERSMAEAADRIGGTTSQA